MFNGDRLKNLRNERLLSQEEVGNLVNVTKVSICGYEKGKRTPDLETLVNLSDAFNVSPNYFLDRELPSVINEDNEEYVVNISSTDYQIIKELRKNKKIYSQLKKDPVRTIELIKRNL